MAPQLPWLQLVEQMLVQQLLRSPTWNRAVEAVVKQVHRTRYGVDPDEMGGTKLDEPGNSFGRHFTEELRNQIGKAEKMEGKTLTYPGSEARKSTPQNQASDEHVESADAAWRHIQGRRGQEPTEQPSHQGFMSDYLEALRGQVKQKKPPG